MIEAALVFAAFTALGAATMAPSISFGDSGELAAAAAGLGLPHAPSYPLYVLAARAFGAAVPLGGWAYRTNLFSDACGAAALALLCDALRRLGCARVPRLLAVAALGLCAAWRRETGLTEVFPLHLLFCAGTLWLCAARAGRLLEARSAAGLGLWFGLGLANHQTLLFGLPSALAAAVKERRKILPPMAVAVSFGVLGVLVYAALPLRSARGPFLDWDHPTTAARLWRVVSRKDYGSLALTTDGSGARGVPAGLAQVSRFASRTWAGLGPLCLLGAAGLLVWPPAWTLGPAFAAVWLLGLGPVFLWLGAAPYDPLTSAALERFYLAPWLALVFGAAAALDRLWRLGVPARCAAAGLGALALWPALSAASLRADFAAYDYGRDLLKTMPPKAALFMDGGDDTFYSLAYLTQGAGLRPDVELHDRGGVVFRSVYGPDFRALGPAEKERRRAEVERLYAADGRLFYSTLAPSLAGLALAPDGLLRAPAPGASDPWPFYAERWDDERAAAVYRDRALLAVYPFMRAEAALAAGRLDEADARLRRARLLAGDALWAAPDLGYSFGVLGYRAAQKRDWVLAERAVAAELALEPANDAARGNLAVIRAQRARAPEARR